ncbi:MAG: hypothetical protein IPO08_19700 [Xanthomonadales bacterium]|nr:hypothetical protein [Xanthomonadales bacterium]
MAKSKYARDPDYGQPVKWAREYDKHFPDNTDGCSRHTKMIAHENLRAINSPVRRMLIDAGYEPDHWAQSMELTVTMLWEARAEIARLKSIHSHTEGAA